MPYLTSILGMLILFGSSALADSDHNPLLADRWKHRPLVVIANTHNDPLLQSIYQSLKDPAIQAEFDDRAMVLYAITPDKATRNGEVIERAETQAILNAFKQAQSSIPSAYLIGLDGGIKLIQQHRIDLQEIFTLIDGMPMRQRELD